MVAATKGLSLSIFFSLTKKTKEATMCGGPKKQNQIIKTLFMD